MDRVKLSLAPFFCLVLLGYFPESFAGTNVASWDIPPSDTSASQGTAVVATGLTATKLTAQIPPLVAGGSSSASWQVTGWRTNSADQNFAGALANTNYWEWSISVGSDYQLSLDGVGQLNVSRGTSGPGAAAGQIGLFYSTNGFLSSSLAGTNLTAISTNSGAPTSVTSLGNAWTTVPVVVNGGQTITFRMVCFGATTTAGTFRIVNNVNPDLILLGTVTRTNLTRTLTWSGGASGIWNTTSTSWYESSPASPVAFANGDSVVFPGGATVSVPSALTVGNISATNLASGQTLAFSGSGSLSSGYPFQIGGSGTVQLGIPTSLNAIQLDGGQLVATVNNALSGALTASAGVQIGNTSHSLGSASFSGPLTGTGVLTATNGDFSFVVDGTALPTNNVSASLAGANAGLIKSGTGSLRLSGASSFGGSISLNGGLLETTAADLLPDTAAVVFSPGTSLRLGGNEVLGGLKAGTSSGATVDLQNYLLTLNVTSSNQFSGILQGSGSVVKQGAAILTVDGVNTFSGGLVLKNGSMRLQGSGSTGTDIYTLEPVVTAGPFGTGLLTIQGGKIYSSGTTSRSIYNGVRIEGDFTIGDTGSGDMNVGTLSGILSNNITTLATNCTLTVSSATDWYQRIEGTGKSLTMTSSSSTQLLRLRGANTLETLAVNRGRLIAQNSNNLATVLVGSNGILGWGWSNIPGVCSYLGNATLILSNGATIGQYGTCGTDTALEKRTLTNNLSLSGDIILGLGTYASTFSGGADLNGGTRAMLLSNSTTLMGPISNGTLVLRTRDLYSGGTFNNGRSLTVSAANTQSGTVLDGSTLVLGHNGGLGSGSLVVNSNPVFDATVVSSVLDTNTGLTNTVTNSYTGVTASNTVSVNADRTVANGISLAAGATLITHTETTTDLVTTNLDLSTITNTITNSYVWTQNGNVSGAGAILKTGTGTLRLAGGVSHTGLTTVAGGNLEVLKTNLTATITPATVGIAFSNNVSAGTYVILPGGLGGFYGPADISGLAMGQSAVFDAAAGSVTVTGNPPSSGPSFADSYPGRNLTDSASNGLSYLMNYAMGGSLTNGISAPLTSAAGSTLSITALVRTNDPKCGVVGEAATSLPGWQTNNPVTGVAASDQTGAVAGISQKQVFSVERGADSKKFLRLKATYNP